MTPVLERHGWSLRAHPLFLGQLERLLVAVEGARMSDPDGWGATSDARLLAALSTLALDRVPRDPLAREFRHIDTLGHTGGHWSRAKFGGNRFRLFFRAETSARAILYAWIKDRDAPRARGATSNPYTAFTRTLTGGKPPDDWPGLLKMMQAMDTTQRFVAARKIELETWRRLGPPAILDEPLS